MLDVLEGGEHPSVTPGGTSTVSSNQWPFLRRPSCRGPSTAYLSYERARTLPVRGKGCAHLNTELPEILDLFRAAARTPANRRRPLCPRRFAVPYPHVPISTSRRSSPRNCFARSVPMTATP